MELLRGTAGLDCLGTPHALTIGNYDGVHLGHQAVLRLLIERGCQDGLVTAAMVFEPTPREFFAADSAPARLSRFREKYTALKVTGLQRMICLAFNARTAAMSPEDFVRVLLVQQLQVKYLLVGADFRYGRGRKGDVQSLLDAGQAHGFEVAVAPTAELDGVRISSTAVRKALSTGDLRQARRLLGRPYRMSGRVIAGKQLGRELGFPTANIGIGRLITPLHGIYAVRVRGVAGRERQWLDGVASLGTRPTVDGGRMLLEVNIFDFAQDIYGQRLDVEFVRYLRAEEHFASLDQLVAQMHVDAAQARQVLASEPAQKY